MATCMFTIVHVHYKHMISNKCNTIVGYKFKRNLSY